MKMTNSTFFHMKDLGRIVKGSLFSLTLVFSFVALSFQSASAQNYVQKDEAISICVNEINAIAANLPNLSQGTPTYESVNRRLHFFKNLAELISESGDVATAMGLAPSIFSLASTNPNGWQTAATTVSGIPDPEAVEVKQLVRDATALLTI